MVFQSAPCAKTHTGVHKKGTLLAAGFEGVQLLAFIVVLVWLLYGHKLHQFVTLDEGQCPGTAVPQLCTLCEHAVLANLVNPIKLGGSARLRNSSLSGRCFTQPKAVHWVELTTWCRIVEGLVAAGQILEHRYPTETGKIEVD